MLAFAAAGTAQTGTVNLLTVGASCGGQWRSGWWPDAAAANSACLLGGWPACPAFGINNLPGLGCIKFIPCSYG